mgnify:CR=1 FL=1
MSSLRLLSNQSLLLAYRHALRLNLDSDFTMMLKQEIKKRRLIHIVYKENEQILSDQHKKRENLATD